MPSLFSDKFMMLGAAASAREKTQSVISSNIANADTPKYRADQRSFADFFEEKMSSVPAPMTRTNEKHFTAESDGGLNLSVFKRSSGEQRMDGNTVNIEQEMTNLAENQLMHELSMKVIQGRITGLERVIKDGGR